jgi:RNA polymerase sigma-70 factor (ECF subfamily)
MAGFTHLMTAPIEPAATARAQNEEDEGGETVGAFHRGDRAHLAACYREHLATVLRAVGGVVSGADRETIVHEVFLRLLSDEGLRRSFAGGSMSAWLRVVARNQAIDYARRRRFEVQLPAEDAREFGQAAQPGDLEQRMDARLTLARFRAEVLPPKWERVFVARFVDGHDQPSAARALKISRTTLAYQEYRIRHLLRRFVLRGERG